MLRDFKVEEPHVIKIDVSKAVPPRLFTYLLGLFPGLLFEISIALANPALAQHSIDRLKQIYPAQAYLLVILFVVSGFVFGQAFVQLAWIVNLIVGGAYRFFRVAVRSTFGSIKAYQWLGELQQKFPKRPFPVRLYSRLVLAARMPERWQQAQPVLRCLHAASERLLKARYGIECDDTLSHSREELHVWFSVLGKPLTQYKEGLILGRTSLACGLAGFTALWWTPILRERFFLALCGVFAFTGCWIAVNQLRWTIDPVKLNTLRLQSVLLDLADVQSTEETEGNDAEGDASE